jgi:hypothetical protein
MSVRLFLSVLLLLWGAAPQSFAISQAEYDHALAAVQVSLTAQVQALRSGQIPTGEPPLLAAKRALGTVRSVEAPGELPQLVDADPLIDAVRSVDSLHGAEKKAGAFEALNRQITDLRKSLMHPQRPSGRVDTAATLSSVRSVLSADEFASDPPPPPSFAQKASAWLDRWLSKLFTQNNRNTSPMPAINPNILQGIFILIVAAAFAALVYILVKTLGQHGAKARPLGLAEEEAVLVQARDNDSLLVLAEEQANKGDYRRAFRLVYLAALVALDTGGVLRFDKSKTNWEYLRALRSAGRSDIYSALTPLTREFDQVWYGLSRTDVSQYAHALAQYHALLAASPMSQSTVRNTVGT